MNEQTLVSNAIDPEFRFEFGKNWAKYLDSLDETRVSQAVSSLQEMLAMQRLDGRSFLDAGSGSGLFSVAARRLGARVHSFDYDAQCVHCTETLRDRFAPGDEGWKIAQASVLDSSYLEGLGKFDIVYSWGVLYHTGDMWRAVDNAIARVAPGGTLFIAMANDQGRASRIWTTIKRTYNALPRALRSLVLVPAFVWLWGPAMIRDLLLLRPGRTWKKYGIRGMSPMRDVVDWVGGYPFQVAKPEEVFDFVRSRGFELRKLRTCGGGIGCNEFVFQRSSP